MEPPYLCLAGRYDELHYYLTDETGQLIDRGISPLQARPFLDSLGHPVKTVGVALTSEREGELKALQTAPSLVVRHCPWFDAVLAGALSGRPGVWLSMDHWIPLAGGCHSNQESCPDHGGQALSLAREANHRTVALVQAEASTDWVARQALQLASPQGGLNGFSLQRVCKVLHPLVQGPPSPQRARQVVAKVQELADFPGPEPASLALLAKTGRRLSDLIRHLCGRVRLSHSRAVWADGPLEGPLWNAMIAEFQRYLPDLRWSTPDHPPETGLLLLLLGERAELQRQALNPNRGEAPALNPWAEFSDDAWRHLARSEVNF